jgi:hypothetical protein
VSVEPKKRIARIAFSEHVGMNSTAEDWTPEKAGGWKPLPPDAVGITFVHEALGADIFVPWKSIRFVRREVVK